MQVRLAVPADSAELGRLLGHMAAHYGETPGEALGRGARLLADPPDGGPICLVADLGGRLAGFAALNRIFPADNLTEALFLKDLWVEADQRGQGVGRALLAGMAALALERGFSRIDWTTEATNGPAARLYDGIGAARKEKLFFRLAGDDLQRAAGLGAS